MKSFLKELFDEQGVNIVLLLLAFIFAIAFYATMPYESISHYDVFRHDFRGTVSTILGVFTGLSLVIGIGRIIVYL